MLNFLTWRIDRDGSGCVHFGWDHDVGGPTEKSSTIDLAFTEAERLPVFAALHTWLEVLHDAPLEALRAAHPLLNRVLLSVGEVERLIDRLMKAPDFLSASDDEDDTVDQACLELGVPFAPMCSRRCLHGACD